MPKKQSLQEFIEKAIEKHGNKYDYSKVEYKNNGTTIEIICPKHGSFFMAPASHTSTGRGCSKCNGGIKYDNKLFIKKATDISPEYDYKKVNYLNAYEKIEVICSKHGSFFISPCKILQGQKCQSCSKENTIINSSLTKEEFVNKANSIHSNKYDYSKVEYINSHTKVKIICSKHGCFEQLPNNHTSKEYGCPKCSMNGTSKQEKEIVDFIKTFYQGEVIENSRSIISPKELDIFIPEKNFAVEYNGLYWHTYDNDDLARNNKKRHIDKTKACTEKNIGLFHVFSDEWNNKQDIIKSMIKYRLGYVEEKIHARKCEIKIISKTEGKQFFSTSHISGDNRASVYITLMNEGNIVSCLSLKKPIQKKYGNIMEIARYANKLNCTVVGGFQKLFKEAKKVAKESNFEGILTYADLRFGTGGVYLKSGFEFLGKTPIDYWYTDGVKREFRFKYRADKENGLTEKQVAEASGVSPIYGCGSNIYLYRI